MILTDNSARIYPKNLTTMQKNLDLLDDYFFYFFAIEMMMKIIAFGFYGEKKSYISINWNRLDFVVVIFGVLTLNSTNLLTVSAIKSMRILRVLKTF